MLCIIRADCRRNAFSSSTVIFSIRANTASLASWMHLPERTIMLTDEAPSRRKSSVQLPARTEEMLVAAILILFLLLHVIAGAVLQHAGAADGELSERGVTLQLYD